MCGKEGAPQCSQCCISCSEASGCTAPSVTGCLDKCCPNKKVCLRERERGWLYQNNKTDFVKKVVDFKSDRRETDRGESDRLLMHKMVEGERERERVRKIMDRKREQPVILIILTTFIFNLAECL